MEDLMFGLVYLAFMLCMVLLPALFLDWLFGVIYRHSRRFRRRVNRFFRSLPQWK